MYKKTIKETVKEYDSVGKVVKETIVETTEEMSDVAITTPTGLPSTPYPFYPYISSDPVCISSSNITVTTQQDGSVQITI